MRRFGMLLAVLIFLAGCGGGETGSPATSHESVPPATTSEAPSSEASSSEGEAETPAQPQAQAQAQEEKSEPEPFATPEQEQAALEQIQDWVERNFGFTSWYGHITGAKLHISEAAWIIDVSTKLYNDSDADDPSRKICSAYVQAVAFNGGSPYARVTVRDQAGLTIVYCTAEVGDGRLLTPVEFR